LDHEYEDDTIQWNGRFNWRCNESGKTFWEETAGNGWGETKCFVGLHTIHQAMVEESNMMSCKKNRCVGHENDEDGNKA
jgi:hypothetical protein